LSHSSSPSKVYFETESHVVQAALELVILLPHPPQCWDYRCNLSCSLCILISLFLGTFPSISWDLNILCF
jgi:hypothetical protein